MDGMHSGMHGMVNTTSMSPMHNMHNTSMMHNMTSTQGHGGHNMGSATQNQGGHMGHTTAGPHLGHNGASGEHTMNVKFETAFGGLYILFEPFILNNAGDLAIACVVLFFLAFFYEGLKVGREELLKWHGRRRIVRNYRADESYNADSSFTRDSSANSSQNIISMDLPPPPNSNSACSWVHVVQSVLHVVQVTLSYLLMLAVMTFQVYIGVAIVLGAGFGYFAFAWKRSSVRDMNEHCH